METVQAEKHLFEACTFNGGNPNEPPLFNEWNSTTNAIYAALSNNQGITVGFDEASCSALDYSTLIYNLSHGRDKARCNKDSSLRESKTWSTTIISTAEESLLTKTKKEQWDSCEMFGVRQLAHNSDS